MQVEEDERFLTTRQEVLDKLAVYCGGRAAEELIFGEMTTGAPTISSRPPSSPVTW